MRVYYHNIYILIVLLNLLLISCSPSFVTVKKNQIEPGWIFSPPRDYLVISGTGESFQEAKMDALKNLKREIVSVIASDISGNTEIINKYYSTNGYHTTKKEITDDIKIFYSSLGYINNISLSDCEDDYWEKTYYKGKLIKVDLKYFYPFPKNFRKKLVNEWWKRYQQLLSEAEELLRKSPQSLAEIESYNKSLVFYKRILRGAIVTRIERKKEALKNKVRSAIIVVKENEIGYIRFYIQINNKPIKIDVPIKINGNCIYIKDKYISHNFFYNIKYEHNPCFFYNSRNIIEIKVYLEGFPEISREVTLPMPHISDQGISVSRPLIVEKDDRPRLFKSVFYVNVFVYNKNIIPVKIDVIKITPIGKLFNGTEIPVELSDVTVPPQSEQKITFKGEKLTTAFYSYYKKAEVKIHYHLINRNKEYVKKTKVDFVFIK